MSMIKHYNTAYPNFASEFGGIKKYTNSKPASEPKNMHGLTESKNIENEISSFHSKCYSGKLEDIKFLIDKNKNSTAFIDGVNNVETLFYIINGSGSGNIKKDIMIYLKTQNLLDLNINHGYALELAVQMDDISLVTFLMDNGVKMEADEDGILLYYAAQKNNSKMFDLLSSSGIVADQDLLNDIQELELSGDMKVIVEHLHS